MTKKRAKRSLPVTERLDHLVQVRISAEVRAKLEAKVVGLRVSESQYVRHLIERDLGLLT